MIHSFFANLTALTFSALFTLVAQAHEVDFYLYRVKNSALSFALPKSAGETPKIALANYWLGVRADRELQKLYGIEIFQNQNFLSEIEVLNPDVNSKGRILVLANELTDILPEARRDTESVFRKNRALGIEPILLPLAAAEVSHSHLGTRAAGASETFIRALALNFDGLAMMGGRDIHPIMYGEKITYSIEPNLRADQAEHRILDMFVRFSTKPFVGFCRGHQNIAAYMGHKLHQDIEKEIPASPSHRGTPHEIRIQPDSWLAKVVGSTTTTVNSHHHQSVVFNPKAHGKVIATDTVNGQVAEAIQYGDRGITFQFHPELTTEFHSAPQILNSIFSDWRKSFRPRRCSSLFVGFR